MDGDLQKLISSLNDKLRTERLRFFSITLPPFMNHTNCGTTYPENKATTEPD